MLTIFIVSVILLLLIKLILHFVQNFILPNLAMGKIVLCDRFFDSSRVYQGYAKNIDDGEIMAVTNFATSGLKPDKTFLLDIDPVVAFKRKGGQEVGDRIEQQSIEYHQKVRQGYLKIAKKDDRFVVLDATKPLTELLSEIVESLKKESII